jgi:hypothetical protein
VVVISQELKVEVVKLKLEGKKLEVVKKLMLLLMTK